MKPVLTAIVTFNRLELTKQCLNSYVRTVAPETSELWVFDNGSSDGSLEWVKDFAQAYPLHFGGVLSAPTNLGTAVAINRIWKKRDPSQYAAKIDNDVVWQRSGWMEKMLTVFTRFPVIGLVGLKRRDLAERCAHPADPVQPHEWFKSKLFELEHGTFIESVYHAMGTCTLFRPEALNKIGFLYQMQDMGNTYGFDDSLAAVRLAKAGFQSAFLRNYEIDHIDPGTDTFSEQKRQHAGQWMEPFSKVRDEILSGTRPYWYGAENE